MNATAIATAVLASAVLFVGDAHGQQRMEMGDRPPHFAELIPNYNIYFCIEGCRHAYCQESEPLEKCTQRLSSLLVVAAPDSGLPEETAMDPIKFPGPFVIDPNKPSRAHALGFLMCMNNC